MNLLPSSARWESIFQGLESINKMMLPQTDFYENMSKLSSFFQSSTVNQLSELNLRFTKLIPDYSSQMFLASSVLEIYRNSTFGFPDYLNGFQTFSQRLYEKTINLSAAFQKIEYNFDNIKTDLEKIPSCLINPTVSGSSHFQLLKNLEYIDPEYHVDKNYFEIIDNNISLAEKKIRRTNKNWLVLLIGAEEAILSRNPDKARHAITSLRELITQILHTRAPDELLKKEYIEEKYYFQGKPTRRARLEYILASKFKDTSLMGVIECDIAAILETFELYQKGTHEILSSLNDEELVFILKRTKLIIEQLL